MLIPRLIPIVLKKEVNEPATPVNCLSTKDIANELFGDRKYPFRFHLREWGIKRAANLVLRDKRCSRFEKESKC